MYRQDADKLGHEPPSGKISPKCVSYKTPDLCRLFASYQMYEKRNRWQIKFEPMLPMRGSHGFCFCTLFDSRSYTFSWFLVLYFRLQS